ncbi:MAG: hypothetical protein KKA64_02845 [Nanoarchaeota archaeon]|nr:hypothetical protein [Nanoarchaeota archaeon]
MVNQEIVEGLKVALSKGESLKQAMQSFYNAGYSKEEVEGAARLLYQTRVQEPMQQPVQPTPQNMPAVPQNQSFQNAIQRPTTQIVSIYESEKPSKLWTVLAIILAVILLACIGLLVGILLYKEQIVKFVDNLFGSFWSMII